MTAVVFLRLAGALQSWGSAIAYSVHRDTYDQPSRSGVIGLLCSAMGLSSKDSDARLKDLARLEMGVRIDRPGTKITDYHTVGAGWDSAKTPHGPPPGIGLLKAEGGIKVTSKTGTYENIQSWRGYLSDASFLVALAGEEELIRSLSEALQNPQRPLYLGRKCCTPSEHVWDREGDYDNVLAALESIPWRPRKVSVDLPKGPTDEIELVFITETLPGKGLPVRDVPVSFEYRQYGTRWVQRQRKHVKVGDALYEDPPKTSTPPAIKLPGWDERRKARMDLDKGLCVFCKEPACEVHHVTYRNAGSEDIEKDLRSLCKQCHSSITMIEYERNMGVDRIDPCLQTNRELILSYRSKILRR